MSFCRRISAIIAGAFACQPAPGLAQDSAAPPADDTIVVLGEGLPETPAAPAYSTVEIDRDLIVTSASGRLEDVLTNVAGFQQFRRSDSRSVNPSAQGATLRALGGNASSRALVLLDGVPLADPFFGFIPFNAAPPELLGEIRVTRGGGSGPFGSGALAGTIELESAGPQQLGPLTASALTNTRGDTEASAILAPSVGDGFAALHGRWDRGDGFFTTPVDQRVPASVRARYDSRSFGGRLVQRVGNAIELQARAFAFRDHRTLRFDGADSSARGEDVSLRLVSRGPWQVDALGYAQWRNFTNVVISSTQFTPVLDQKDTPSTGLGGRLEVRPPTGGGHNVRFGIDYRRSRGELFEDAFSAFSGALREERFAGGTSSDLGLYAENDWQAGALTLTGGLRADRYTIADGFYRALNAEGGVLVDEAYPDRSDWNIGWRAGALYRPVDAVSLRAAAYSGLRLPTLNELYRPFVVFPVVTQANPALLPERLEGWEFGVDLRPAEGVSLAATWFDNRVKDAIANVTLEPNLRQRRNLDAIEARGLELAAEMRRGAFDLAGTLAMTEASIVGAGPAAQLDGNRPPQVPRLAASLTAAWRFVPDGRLAATLRHVGAQFEDDLETDILPAATTLDLYGQFPVGRALALVGRVENLTGETVVTRNQGGSIDLGAPRTVWLGVRYGY